MLSILGMITTNEATSEKWGKQRLLIYMLVVLKNLRTKFWYIIYLQFSKDLRSSQIICFYKTVGSLLVMLFHEIHHFIEVFWKKKKPEQEVLWFWKPSKYQNQRFFDPENLQNTRTRGFLILKNFQKNWKSEAFQQFPCFFLENQRLFLQLRWPPNTGILPSAVQAEKLANIRLGGVSNPNQQRALLYTNEL